MTKAEMIKVYGQTFYDEMQARTRAKQKEKYWDDPEAARKKNREYVAVNREKIRASWAKSRANRREKCREDAKRYHWENREACLERMRQWKLKNRDKLRHYSAQKQARRRSAVGGHSFSEWRDILKAHNSRCAYCKSKKNITKDHIIPLSKGGTNYALNLQPLCHHCNMVKNSRLLHERTLFDLAAM